MLLESIAGPAGTLHIDDGGAGGTPVLFVHSFAGSAKHWDAQLQHLRTTRRAIAFDLRGHGQSTPPPNEDYEIASFAEDIAAVADGLHLKRFVLVGHSLGGAAALDYAAKHPERVAGLMLVGTPGKTPPEQSRQIMESLRSDYDTVMNDYEQKLVADAKPSVRDELVREMQSLPKETSLRIIQATFDYDPLPELREYPGPKLIVYTASGNTPNDLQNLAPGIPHETIAGTSHWIQMDKPAEFNDLLDRFLSKVES